MVDSCSAAKPQRFFLHKSVGSVCVCVCVCLGVCGLQGDGVWVQVSNSFCTTVEQKDFFPAPEAVWSHMS